MKNYAKDWKKKTNFIQLSYEDFVVDYPNLTGVYMEKIDGMLGALIYKNDKAFLQTTKAHKIENLPVIDEYIAFFQKAGISEAIIAGEMVAKKGGNILPFNATQSIVKTAYKVPAYQDMVYHYPVDVISLDGKPLSSFPQALSFITKRIGNRARISIPNYTFGGLKEFRNLYRSIEDVEGYDGVVYRGTKNFKIKFTSTVDLLVMGAGKEGLPAWSRNQVSYLLSSFIDKDGIYRSSSKIGTGYSATQRSKLYDFVKKNEIYTESGESFIKPGLIVEVKFFRNRLTETPSYVFRNGRYEFAGMKNSVTFSHPSFVRIRNDKKANKFDVRLEQIPKFKY